MIMTNQDSEYHTENILHSAKFTNLVETFPFICLHSSHEIEKFNKLILECLKHSKLLLEMSHLRMEMIYIVFLGRILQDT
jgi:hypothetical protein